MKTLSLLKSTMSFRQRVFSLFLASMAILLTSVTGYSGDNQIAFAQVSPSPSPVPVVSTSSSPASSNPSSAPVGVIPPAPISAPVGGGSPTIYTGPGFVNVTPFSTFGRVSIDRIINNAINYISGFLATIAVLSLMYGGVLYMTAGGDNGKIGKAKQVIVLTIVGLVIGSFAYMIIIFTTRLFYGS